MSVIGEFVSLIRVVCDFALFGVNCSIFSTHFFESTDILFRQSKPLQNFVESNFLFFVNYRFFFALQSFSINGFCSIFQNSYFFKVLRDVHDCSGFEKYLH
jgi:hypothetical protein